MNKTHPMIEKSRKKHPILARELIFYYTNDQEFSGKEKTTTRNERKIIVNSI